MLVLNYDNLQFNANDGVLKSSLNVTTPLILNGSILTLGLICMLHVVADGKFDVSLVN